MLERRRKVHQTAKKSWKEIQGTHLAEKDADGHPSLRSIRNFVAMMPTDG
jgi:hypothetical protein